MIRQRATTLAFDCFAEKDSGWCLWLGGELFVIDVLVVIGMLADGVIGCSL